MQVHFKNFGSKTAMRCGFQSGQYNYPAHIHQFPEIVYVSEGSLEVTIDGKRELMLPGDFAIIPPFRIHSFFTPETVTRWVCVFSPDFISSFISRDELFGNGESCIVHASEGLKSFANEYMIETNELFFELTEEIIRTYKSLIFAVYSEYLNKVPRTEKRKYHQALSSILSYVSEHYTEDISLHSIGAALNYSPKYVSLCLSEVDEMNLNQLINSFRADHAKTLLSTTKKKMIDVALECGYANERSFYRAFLRVTNMTPGEYRRSKRTLSTQENEKDYYPVLYEEKQKKKHEKAKRSGK
ncbi:MAG: AraC family transcriptional regulator [Ruminococcaceae bacterium]|nr:AraC family transcriptional regulator [Oscillospiraceae bacterium]